MRLLWGEPGNEALKAENEGRVWEPGYCGERLGMSLLWGEPGNESVVGRAWE